MRLILTFFVLNLMFVVLVVFVALLGGVLALQLMHWAWLECLVAAIGRGPVLLFLFAFVVVITTTAVVVILPLVVVMIVLVALPAVVTVTSLRLFHHMADLLIKPLAQFVTHLVSHALLDLTLAFPHQGAICYLRIKNVLKVLCDRLERLVAKTSTTLDVLCPVLFVRTCRTTQAVAPFWVDACLLLGELLPSKSSLQIIKDDRLAIASSASGRHDLRRAACKYTAYL